MIDLVRGGKQHQVSYGDDYSKVFTTVIWLYVNNFFITVSEDGGFYVHRLNSLSQATDLT